MQPLNNTHFLMSGFKNQLNEFLIHFQGLVYHVFSYFKYFIFLAIILWITSPYIGIKDDYYISEKVYGTSTSKYEFGNNECIFIRSDREIRAPIENITIDCLYSTTIHFGFVSGDRKNYKTFELEFYYFKIIQTIGYISDSKSLNAYLTQVGVFIEPTLNDFKLCSHTTMQSDLLNKCEIKYEYYYYNSIKNPKYSDLVRSLHILYICLVFLNTANFIWSLACITADAGISF